jgi:dienelactone hydrolase
MRETSISITRLVGLLLGTISVSLAFPLQAQVARMELHTIHSQSPTDQEFLSGKRDAKAVVINGELRLPGPGAGALSAIVLLHGSGGVTGLVDDWAREFNSMGVATFIVDSFTGRGLTNLSDDQDQLGRLAMVLDAYRALELLAKHPRIDPKRILVMGWSRGGGAAHWASIKRFRVMHGPPGELAFAGYVALYPTCNWYFSAGLQLESKPVRIYHGSSDDYVPVKSCRGTPEGGGKRH